MLAMTDWARSYVTELAEVLNATDVEAPLVADSMTRRSLRDSERGAIEANASRRSNLLGEMVAQSTAVRGCDPDYRSTETAKVLRILNSKSAIASERLAQKLGSAVEARRLESVRAGVDAVPGVVKDFALLARVAFMQRLIGPVEQPVEFGRAAVQQLYDNAQHLNTYVRVTGGEWGHRSLLRLSPGRIAEIGNPEFDEVRENAATIKFAAFTYPEAPAKVLRLYIDGSVVLGGAAWRRQARFTSLGSEHRDA